MNKYKLALILALFWGENTLYAGKLQAAREAVRSGSNDDWDDDEDDEKGGGPLADLFAFIEMTEFLLTTATSPFWGPHLLLDKNNFSEFISYPYQDDYKGYMRKSGSIDKDPDISFRSYLEHGYDFEGVTSFTGNLLFDTESRFSFELGSTYMREWLDLSTYDSLTLYKANLLFRFVQNPHIQMRTGLGSIFMNDYAGTEAGFLFNYSLDIYPLKPWIISAALDIGTLGKANYSNSRYTVGALWGRFEMYGGYNSLRIDLVLIQGPVFGIRYWW